MTHVTLSQAKRAARALGFSLQCQRDSDGTIVLYALRPHGHNFAVYTCHDLRAAMLAAMHLRPSVILDRSFDQ